MSTVVFRRPVRNPGPVEPGGEIVLEPPPELPKTVSSDGIGQALTYLPMLAGAGGTALLVAGTGGQPITYLASGLMGLSMVAMAFTALGRRGGEKGRRLDADRLDYQRYLERLRAQARSAASQQRTAVMWHHPDPAALPSIAFGNRLWERRPGDEDFLAVRVAHGERRLSVALITPETKPMEDLEPISAAAMHRFVRTHRSVDDLPVTLALPEFARLSVSGPRHAARALARAMVVQLAALHSPEDLVIAACAAGEAEQLWDWLKWLPHALSTTACDGVGQVRLVSDDLLTLEGLFGETLTNRARFSPAAGAGAAELPHVVAVIDGGHVAGDAQLATSLIRGVTVIDLSDSVAADAGSGVARLDIRDGKLTLSRTDVARGDESTPLGEPDALSLVEAETLARRMSPMRASKSTDECTDPPGIGLTLAELLRLGDPHTVEPAAIWKPRAPRDRLRVPIGVDLRDQPIELDIKESAEGGMGPHGLVIGATGSGKSELLRTLVLGLALTHSPEQLNFVLVDFKGGATFASMGALPHTSGLITNLADELTLVDRMRGALHGEVVRRQEILRAAGNYASTNDYERAREQGAELEPMPSLLVVVDEFSELLTAKPDFIDLFMTIGRVGRSLGVHLILASQRLEEGRLRGLDTHLSYRIGLRTFSPMESRVVLGVPDAYELPSAPGNAYLKDATAGVVRFMAAYVSGPCVSGPCVSGPCVSGPCVSGPCGTTRHSARVQSSTVLGHVLPYELGYRAPPDEQTETPAAPVHAYAEPESSGPDETMLDVLLGRLAGAGTPARRIWLPPLGAPPTLDALLPPLKDTELGLRPIDWDPRPSLAAPIGLLDRPFDQRREPHWLDLSSSHFVVAGRPQSGKSTLLRSLIAGFALTHTPEQAQFYALDFGGGTLTALADLPHVGSVAGRLEPERLRRTVAEITALLTAREQRFTRQRIDSMAAYRRMVAAGTASPDGFGDVFLVVDGWGTLRQDHEELEAAVTQIAARGLGYGVHLVLSIQRWMDLRPALRDLISTRLELRLGDPAESEVDRRLAADVPPSSPGRGLSAHKLHFQSALPRIDGNDSADELAVGVADLVDRVRAAWPGEKAPPVRLLPQRLSYDELPPANGDGAAVTIGVDEDNLAPVYVDFDRESHFLVIGDTESGKSNALRVLARGITARWTPDDAKIITFDYRRGLLGAVTSAHQIGYVRNSVAAPDVVDNVVAALRERLAGIDTLDPLRGQVPVWTGPRLFLLVDDYDLVATASGNPLLPLLEFLPQARDIGLHVVASRAAGGVGHGIFEPFLRSIRDMGAPGLLLSGSKDEGAVLGSVRMGPLPPGRGRLVRRRIAVKLIQSARA